MGNIRLNFYHKFPSSFCRRERRIPFWKTDMQPKWYIQKKIKVEKKLCGRHSTLIPMNANRATIHEIQMGCSRRNGTPSKRSKSNHVNFRETIYYFSSNSQTHWSIVPRQISPFLKNETQLYSMFSHALKEYTYEFKF